MRRKVSISLANQSEYLDRLAAGLLRRKPVSLDFSTKKSILLLKCTVLGIIALVAGVIGFVAYDVVRDSEYKQFTQAYNTLIDEIVPSTNIGMIIQLTIYKYNINSNFLKLHL